MNKRKRLLSEDDCAPDSTEYFEKEMFEKFNLSIKHFKHLGKLYWPDDTTAEWHYKNYVLSFHGDDPFYKLDIKVVEDGQAKCTCGPNKKPHYCELHCFMGGQQSPTT